MTTSSRSIEEVRTGKYDRRLSTLYGTGEDALQRQRARYARLLMTFSEEYGGDRDTAIYSSPGRVELCGNHTDHNGGVVLAAAVNLDVVAVVSKSDENRIRIRSEGFDGEFEVGLSNLDARDAERGTPSAMIRGIAAALKGRGGKIGGFDACVASDVLVGSGLSSSAAFEVCVGAVLNREYNGCRFGPIELGVAGQQAENAYYGKPSGLMDQIACATGGVMAIDFEDPAAPLVSKMSFDLSDYGLNLVVTDTKGDHANLTGEYAAIRNEMERAARFFGAGSLRGVRREAFFARIADVRREAGDRAALRAIHFFEECRRVGELISAIKESDDARFLALITESGHSSFEYNQNAYCAAEPERQGVPLGLAISQSILGRRGAWRLQGGGFAGAVQAFVPSDLLDEYRAAMELVFGCGACRVLSFRDAGPVEVTGDLQSTGGIGSTDNQG